MELCAAMRISAETAERRALGCMGKTPLSAAYIAEQIWPGHAMKPQGAGAAAARILKRLEGRGLVEWRSNGTLIGWAKVTRTPQAELQLQPETDLFADFRGS